LRSATSGCTGSRPGLFVDNVASQRVLEKNGFEQVGIARGYLHIGGEWRDHVLFQLLAD
jgi:ribosomal-protein-alanine N-acetyltransferase